MLDPEIISGVHWPRRSRCSVCKSLFHPHPRLKLRQKTCGKKECLLSHRARFRRKYRRLNSESEKGYQEKVKSTRGPDFWRNYRTAHPPSTKRNRLNARLRQNLRRTGLQRQLDIVEVIDSPGVFELFHEFDLPPES